MPEALRRHWPEYLMEAAGLGIFMVSACAFGTLLEHPASPLRQALADATLRRVLMGLAMGGTFLGIFFSPWGKRSGAHLNPAVTLTFFRLGKVPKWDALFYAAAQALGGLLGVLLSAAALGMLLRDPSVRYVVTVPGEYGAGVAFAAELAIAFLMMATVLVTLSHARLMRLTPVLAAALVALYISLEAPYSGMSLNPARSFASALPAGVWTAWWVYLLAPPLGMLMAAESFRWLTSARARHCAKINHANAVRCIFCGPDRLGQTEPRRAA